MRLLHNLEGDHLNRVGLVIEGCAWSDCAQFALMGASVYQEYIPCTITPTLTCTDCTRRGGWINVVYRKPKLNLSCCHGHQHRFLLSGFSFVLVVFFPQCSCVAL